MASRLQFSKSIMKELIGKKVKELRLLYNQTQEGLAKALGVSKEFISMIESGKRLPSLKTMSRLGKIFNKETDFFLREEEEPFAALFRVETLGAPGRLALDRAAKFCENYAFLEKETGQHPVLPPAYPEKPGIAKSLSALKEDAEHLADSEWGRLGLGDEPIKDIFSLIESQGVHVIRQEMGNVGFDGAFLCSSKNGAFLIINASRPLVCQVFTAAHEYCHCLKHRNRGIQIDRNIYEDYLNTDAPTMECYANAFAASFLMPRKAIARALKNLNKHLEAEEVIQLKRYFGVSYQAIVWRLVNLKSISKSRTEELLQIKPRSLEESIFGDTEETVMPAKMPERYVRIALDAYLMGKITVSRLAELLNKDVFELKKVLAESELKRSRGGVGRGAYSLSWKGILRKM